MRKNSKPPSFLHRPVHTVLLLPLLLSGLVQAQQLTTTTTGFSDPGPRPGPAGAGLPLKDLSGGLLAAFNEGLDVFKEVDGVAEGLGPRFNADSCAACHAQPA